uniref:Uncharacterized protein n=1 Tax=Amphimedon queenslandica TaxID=400682 RepID=A0A1X7UXJ3_AMPQE
DNVKEIYQIYARESPDVIIINHVDTINQLASFEKESLNTVFNFVSLNLS